MKTEVIFKKFDAAKQQVFGIVYRPLKADSQGDWMTAEGIEAIAHDFNSRNRAKAIDVEHNLKASGAVVVESFIARKNDPDYPEGSWVMGTRCPDAIWSLIKSGKINGYSMYGRGTRVQKSLPGDPAAKFELTDGEITAVSLVQRGATREEFAVIKNDIDPVEYIGTQMQALAQHMMTTNTAIADIVKKQATIDQQIASLGTGTDGRIVRKAATVDTNAPAGDYELRKQARLQERLESIFERPDLFHDSAEFEVRRKLEKSADKLYALGHQEKAATLDTGSAFLMRGGSSTFLQASPSSLDDILGVSRSTRELRKAEDEINVTNNLVL